MLLLTWSAFLLISHEFCPTATGG